jgi:hypothetical protein
LLGGLGVGVRGVARQGRAARRHGDAAAVASGQARQAGLVGLAVQLVDPRLRVEGSGWATVAGWSSCTQRSRSPAKLGSWRLAAGGDRGGRLHAHWWHLWLLEIPLPAPQRSMGRRRPGGLGRARRLHGIWRTAEGPRQLAWGAQHGAEDAPELGGGRGPADAAPGDEAVGPDQQRSPDPMPWAAAPSAGVSSTPKR